MLQKIKKELLEKSHLSILESDAEKLITKAYDAGQKTLETIAEESFSSGFEVGKTESTQQERSRLLKGIKKLEKTEAYRDPEWSGYNQALEDILEIINKLNK